MRLPDAHQLPLATRHLLSAGTHFATASSASLTSFDDDLVIRSGKYPHQFGQLGLMPSPWTSHVAPPPRLLDETFRSLGFGYTRFEDGVPIAAPQQLDDSPSGMLSEVVITKHPGEARSAALARADAWLDRSIARAAWKRRARPLVVVIASDFTGSGEGWNNRGLDLIVAPPPGVATLPAGSSASSIDVMPTLLDWVHAGAAADSLPGRSLLRSTAGGRSVENAPLYMSRDFAGVGRFAPVRAMRTARHVIARRLPASGGIGRRWDDIQLFDLERDPACLTDVSADPAYGGTVAALARRLDRWRRATQDPWISATV